MRHSMIVSQVDGTKAVQKRVDHIAGRIQKSIRESAGYVEVSNAVVCLFYSTNATPGILLYVSY